MSLWRLFKLKISNRVSRGTLAKLSPKSAETQVIDSINQFCFMLNFKMHTRLMIPIMDSELDLSLISKDTKIYCDNSVPSSIEQWLTIKSCGYATVEQATFKAASLKDAMLLAGIEGLGFDFGIDKKRSISTAFYRRASPRTRDMIHGIDVYSGRNIKHHVFSATASTSITLQNLKKNISRNAELGSLTDRSRRCAELINDSLFVQSADARFIITIAAIEAFCEQKKHPDELADVKKVVLQQITSLDADPKLKEIITKAVTGIAYQSIGEACRNKIQDYLGKDEAKRFGILYKNRSKFLHEGEQRAMLSEYLVEAYEIACRLIREDLRRKKA